MAEGLLRHYLKATGRGGSIIVGSAGTHASQPGAKPDLRARRKSRGRQRNPLILADRLTIAGSPALEDHRNRHLAINRANEQTLQNQGRLNRLRVREPALHGRQKGHGRQRILPIPEDLPVTVISQTLHDRQNRDQDTSRVSDQPLQNQDLLNRLREREQARPDRPKRNGHHRDRLVHL